MTISQKLYMPFQFSEGKAIGDPIPYIGNVGGYPTELNGSDPHYSITLSNIPSGEEATVHFEKLIVGLFWVALETRSGLLIQQQLQSSHYPEDPIKTAKNIFGETTDRRADVMIDGNRPAIWPDDKQAVKLIAGQVRAFISYKPSRFLEVLDEGMRLSNPKAITENSKLKLAIELYCLSHFRASDFARFLVLCTVLETAAPDHSLSELSVKLVDQWIIQAHNALSRTTNKIFTEDLTSLKGSLNYLKTRSHRSRIQHYVKSMLDKDGNSDSSERAKEARDLYDVRSQLSHTGKYELGDSLTRLDEIVCRTLKAAMRNT